MSWVSSKTSYDTASVLRTFLNKKGFSCEAWSRKDSSDHDHRAIYVYPRSLTISLNYLNRLGEVFETDQVGVSSEIERTHEHESSIMYVKLIISEDKFNKIISDSNGQ